ncbi:HAD-IA family hydrolase [Empedobacter falsenii]|uniref:HAD-IA family hydrolase n=1 Tax=Empedobacter falsenii TaxID=343874 RepID=A0ABY8VBF9_9FLAO|nr:MULTISPECIES: HAD-IA family hydrolase [Empedobacter]MDM1521957.1 HAD-IA family hydrolase [Empedobacter sp. 225-1]WIH97598.1 HAD-IA family hydrolase [Empedobacter falsenii]
MIKTVIFDMDGVIVDTEPVHKYAYFEHYKELNIPVTEELFATFTGQSTKNVYQILKDKFDLKEEVNDLVLRKRAIFNEAFDTKPDLYLIDGVEELIKDLYANKIELILASSASKSTIDRVFSRFQLDQYFSHKISGENFPKSKPDPAIFLHAAEIAKSEHDECIVIEDSTNGIEAAFCANLYCLGYKSVNSKNQNLEKANSIVDDFKQINAAYIIDLK